MENPFTPNFGQVPMHIAGRDVVIQDVLQALKEETPGNPARTSILVGARGSGKTALLSYLAEESRQYGWIGVNVTCIRGMQEDILQQAQIGAEALLPKKRGKHLSGISVGQLFSASWEAEEEDRPNWRTRITYLLNAIEKYGTGLLITIDEVTPRLDEMIQVASVYQLLIRENKKIALLMAGLPSEVSLLLNDRAVSFLRRASQYQLGRIEDYEIESAFLKTVEDAGKSADTKAVRDAVRAIAGFPYMMQLVGFRAWQASQNRKRITETDVKEGINIAKEDFESRVIRATYRELSPGDRAFLDAMLPDDNISEISQIEKRLEKNSGYVSSYRKRLMESGVIESAGRGRVRFALPGIKDYILRLSEEK